jgi:hypothetical protein
VKYKRPVRFDEIKSGMKLWDDKEKRWAKVLRVYLWDGILKENPGRYCIYTHEPV